MKDYVALWLMGLAPMESQPLPKMATAQGEHQKHSASKSEFAQVKLSVSRARKFELTDNVPCRTELESLNIGWPDCVVLGVLDALMLAECGPYYNFRLVLEEAAYHEVNSTAAAFRCAGRDAGNKIVYRFSNMISS